MATPLAFRSRTTLISCSTSLSPRLEVGSSMMMTLAPVSSAFAISTIWSTPMPKMPAGFVTSTLMPIEVSSSSAFACIAE